MRNVVLLVAVILIAGFIGWTAMRFTSGGDAIEDAEAQSGLLSLAEALRLDERIEWQVMPDTVPAAVRFPSTIRYRQTNQFWRSAVLGTRNPKR